MAQAGLFVNPLAPATGAASTLNPLVSAPPPPAATGLDALQQSLADIAAIGEQARQRVPIIAPQVAVETGPAIAYSPSTKQFYVQGQVFAEDDAQRALESEALLGQPGGSLPQGGDWVPVDPQSYAGYLGRIKNPTLGTLAARNFGRGVDTMQLLAGRGLQLLGAEETGAGIVSQQMEDLRKTTPYERTFTEIESGRDAVEWFVANLAQQGPNLLESIAVAAAGAAAGTASGGPGLGTLGGAIAGLAGKSQFKNAVLAAARKQAAGEALDAAERKVLRSAAGIAGATAASYASNVAMGASDIYGELRDRGADPDDVNAKMTALFGSLPYAALETLPEFLLAGRVLGGVAAPRAMAAGTSLRGRGAELLRRGAVGGAVGALGEGGTELGQEALLLSLSDQDLSKPENVQRLINSFAAGAAIGGPIGAVFNLKGKQPENLLNPGQNPDEPGRFVGPRQPYGPRQPMGPPAPEPELPLRGGGERFGPQEPLIRLRPLPGEPELPMGAAYARPEQEPELPLGPPVPRAQMDLPFAEGLPTPSVPVGTQGELNLIGGRGTMPPSTIDPRMRDQQFGPPSDIQDILPFESGLAPFRYAPTTVQEALPPTLEGNTALQRLQRDIEFQQAQAQAAAQPTVTPEVTALEQRLAESQPFLEVMGTEGRLIQEPQYGITPEQARQVWLDTKAGRTRNWNQLSENVRNQWIDALNGTYTADDLKQIKRDLSAAESAARLTKSTPRVVVTGAITPNPVLKKEAPRAAKKPKAVKVPTKKQPGTGRATLARPVGAATPAPTGKQQAKPEGKAKAAPVSQQPRKAVQVLKKGKPAPTYESVREDIMDSADADIISQEQYDLLIRAVDNKTTTPDRIKAQLAYLEKGGTVKKLAAGEAFGLRAKEREVVREEGPAEVAEDLTAKDIDYRELNNEIVDARDSKKIYPLQARVLQDMVAQRKPISEIRRALVGFTNANKALNKKQEINRRDFLAGLASTIAIAAGVDNKAYAQIGKTGSMNLNKIIEGLSPAEAAIAALRWIVDNSTSSFERRIAAKLLKNGMGDTVLVTQESLDKNLYGTSAVDETGRSTVTIFTPQGVNVETVLHELIHAYIQQRWAGLGVYFQSNKRILKDTTDRNDKLVKEIQDLWSSLRRAIERDYPSVLESAEWAAALGDPDELIAWVMTNPDIQAFMRTITPEGKPTKTPKNSMWEAFKKWVMELLGMKYIPSELTALDRILGLGEQLIDAGAAVRTGDFSVKMARAIEEQGNNMLVNERRVDTIIDGMPSSLRDPVRTITDMFGGAGIRTVTRFGLRDQVLRLAESLGIKSAARFSAAIAARRSTLTRHEQPYLKWAESYTKLPASEQGIGGTSANGLIEKMTQDEKWAFMPDYFVGDDRKALEKIKLDPELQRWYNGLSREGQTYVREAFRLNYQQLMDMQKAVVDNTASQFDVFIENAKDEAAKKKLEAEKKASLDRYRTMLQMDPTRPYAPLRQDGDWVVVGRSKELVDALSAEAKDYALIRKLEESADHYYVDFAQTRPEALKIARGLEGTYAATQYFRKADSAQNLYGGGDVMYAFQKLNALLQDLAVKDEMKQQVRNAVAQLQLQVMASNSARKAELRRRGIATGSVDMLATTLSHGRSTSQFIASVAHNEKILETLRLMGQEVRTFGPEREAKQEVYNSLVSHYMVGLTPQPQNTLTDKLTGFSSAWMLLFSPSYYIQQLLQNLMLTMPKVAARYGYSDTYAAFKQAYAQVAKAWVDTGATGQLNIDLIDEKYRPLAIFISESGALDVGLDREMGTLTADSGGTTSKPFEKVVNVLRGTTRKLEAINRLAAAITVYELSGSKGRGEPVTVDAETYRAYKKDFGAAHPGLIPLTQKQYAAALEALGTINETHGDYSFENASNILRNPLGRVVLQFQKFRLIVAGLYVRAFFNAFMDPSLSPTEKRVARRTLMFVSGHAAIMGGLIGSPAAAIFVLIYNILSGDDEERGDLERDIREAVGDDFISNLLLRGVPSAIGVDVSGTLGLGNLLSVAPYADAPTDRDTYAKYILSLTGPAIGGIGANVFDAVSLMGDGNYYKGLEKLMPRGIGAASRTWREQVTGETTRRDDLLTQPLDLGLVEAAWGTLGLQPISRVNRQYARDQFYKDEKFYQDKAADIKRAYVSASKDNDTDTMNVLRLEWKGLQAARRERGFKTQPVLDLIKAPREQAKREKQTVGGIPFTTGTEGRAKQIAETAGTAR